MSVQHESRRLVNGQTPSERIAERLDIKREAEIAEVRILRARATATQCVSWLFVWVLLWFSVAIAAAGVKVGQYIWQTWTPGM